MVLKIPSYLLFPTTYLLLLTSRLTCLASYVLSDVSDTLPLVWLRLLDGSYECREVTYLLLVDTRDVDHILLVRIRRYGDTGWSDEIDLMRESDREDELRRRSDLELVSDSEDLEGLLVPLRYSDDHVRDECTGESPLSALTCIGFIDDLHDESIFRLLDRYILEERVSELTLRTGDREICSIYFYAHTGGESNREFSNSRHTGVVSYEL